MLMKKVTQYERMLILLVYGEFNLFKDVSLLTESFFVHYSFSKPQSKLSSLISNYFKLSVMLIDRQSLNFYT